MTASSCFRVHDSPENPLCPVSCGIKGVLGGVQARVDGAVLRELAQASLADIVAELSADGAMVRG